MNILKNMEIIFVVALALGGSAVYVNAVLPSAQASATAGMPIVSVVGKRMTAQEKIQSLQEEQRQASLGSKQNEI